MVKKVFLLSLIIAAFAVVGTGCEGESADAGSQGLIFCDNGTVGPINFYPLEWNENKKITYSGNRVNIFIDAGLQNAKYAVPESMYISIMNSIPVIISEEFSGVQETNLYKVVDDVFEFKNMQKYLSPTGDTFLNQLTEQYFYGSFYGVDETIWKTTPPEGHENRLYYSEYTPLTNFLGNDYCKYGKYSNLYIIASGFTTGGSCDDADIFEKFCSSVYREILNNHEDMTVGIVGFITETTTGASPYFIMAIGQNDDVYKFVNRIDEANRGSFDENDFFVMYINQQIIMANPDGAEYAIKAEGDIEDCIACEDMCSSKIEGDHYLCSTDVYETSGTTQGRIMINLPYSLPQCSSLDICCETYTEVSVVKGQTVYTGNISGLAKYGVEAGGISSDEYEFVYSGLGPMSETQREAFVQEQTQEYYRRLDQVLPDELTEQIIAVTEGSSKQTPFYVAFSIDGDQLDCDMPYVVNMTVRAALTVNNDILNYSEYETNEDCAVFSMQDMQNIDTINLWNGDIARGLSDGISRLIGKEETYGYEFVKSINFIIYKN